MNPWGFHLYKDNQIQDLEELKQFQANDFNLSDDLLKQFQSQNNAGGGVQFSITASLDVLRQRMLGAIRRNQHRNKVSSKHEQNHICRK